MQWFLISRTVNFDYEKEKGLMIPPHHVLCLFFVCGGKKKGELNQGSEKTQKQKQLNKTRQ